MLCFQFLDLKAQELDLVNVDSTGYLFLLITKTNDNILASDRVWTRGTSLKHKAE